MAKRFSIPPVPTGEVASYTSDPYTQNIIGGYPWLPGSKGDLVLRPQDELLIQKGGSQALNIYQKLLFDSTVQSAWNKVAQDIIYRKVVVDAVSESPGDIAVKDFVENQLRNIPFDQITKGFLEAYIVGFSVGEIMWKKVKGANIISNIFIRDSRRFRFSESPGKSGFNLRLLTRKETFDGEPVPSRKFIVFRYWTQANGDPYGCGLGRILYPLVKFKRRALESQLLYSDRYANPTAVATAPLSATTQEIETLYNHLSNLSQETAMVLPEGYNISFINPSGTPDTFIDIRESLIKEINMLITGEDEAGTSGAGSRASSEVALRVREVRAEELSQLLCEVLNQTLIRWIVDANFGVDVESPRIKRDFSVESDLKLTIGDLATLSERLGFTVKKSWVEENFNVVFEESKPEQGVEGLSVDSLVNQVLGEVDQVMGDETLTEEGVNPEDIGISDEQTDIEELADMILDEDPNIDEIIDEVSAGGEVDIDQIIDQVVSS
jgi:phage gp29-like protein